MTGQNVICIHWMSVHRCFDAHPLGSACYASISSGKTDGVFRCRSVPMPLRGQSGCKISFGRRLARKLLDEAMPEVSAADSRARKSVTTAGARDGSGLHRDAVASILLSRLAG